MFAFITIFLRIAAQRLQIYFREFTEIILKVNAENQERKYFYFSDTIIYLQNTFIIKA